MLHFSEELIALIKEADKWFPNEGHGYNYDEWDTVEHWKEYITKKIADEKKRRGLDDK